MQVLSHAGADLAQASLRRLFFLFSPNPHPTTLWAAPNLEYPQAFPHLLMNSTYYTEDPEQADYFYVWVRASTRGVARGGAVYWWL